MPAMKTRPTTAKDWERFFTRSGVRNEELIACKSSRSKAIKIGNFLSSKLGREVPIDVSGRTGKAVLRVEMGRAKEKRYYFEVTWDTPDVSETTAVRPEQRRGKAGADEKDRGQAPKVARPAKKAASQATPTHERGAQKAKKKKHATETGPDHLKEKPARGTPRKARGKGNDEPW